MRRLVLLTPVVFLSCGLNMKRAAMPVPPLPPVVESSARPPEPGEEGEREDSYQEAAEFYLLKRVPPGEDLPVERYITAKQHAERMPLYSLAQRRFVGVPQKGTVARDANLGAWQPLGPGNVGGRTRAFLINPTDPNTMYAGSVGGGVWKTTDGGASWNPLSDLLPSIGIGSLAMDPQDPNTLYAGTGEYYVGNSIRGLGIFKSTDGGASWTQLPPTATATRTSFYYVNKIVVSPNDSRRIYAATWTGIWFSADGGGTWQNILNRFPPNNGCQDLVIRTDLPSDYLFAACGIVTNNVTQAAVLRNMDAAGSGRWESVLAEPAMGRTSLALAPSSQSTVYAISADSTPGADTLDALLAVYRSDSNGDSGTWNTQTSNQDSNRLNKVLLSNPLDAFVDVCTSGKPTFVLGNRGILAGRATTTGHADVHGIVFAPRYNGADNQTP